MVGFWISAGLMVAMVAAVLVQAMRRAPQASRPGAEDLAVYRDQLAEVERDLGRGLLPPAEAARLRLEVQRRMLDADRQGQAGAARAPVGLGMAAGVVVLALAAAGLLYLQLGVPGYPDLPISARLAMADEAYRNRPTQAALEARQPAFAPPSDVDKATLDLIERLRQAMASRPDDLQGQTLLAENEAKLGNYAGAAKAQAAVVRLKGSSAGAQDYGAEAELLILAAGGVVSPEAEAALAETLRRDPKDGSARFYLGLMAAQVGRPDRTFAMWKPLLDEGPADAPWTEAIRGQIQTVADAAGIDYVPAAAPQAPGPDAAAVADAAQMSPADRQKMIEGMVGGLESRLMAEGGSLQDWTRLFTALGVLQAKDRASAAYAKAKADFAGRPGELSALTAAAKDAGVTP